MAQLVKNPPAMQETWVQSLGWEDPLEKGKSTHSSILAWRTPWTDCVVHGVAKSLTRLKATFTFTHFHSTVNSYYTYPSEHGGMCRNRTWPTGDLQTMWVSLPAPPKQTRTQMWHHWCCFRGDGMRLGRTLPHLHPFPSHFTPLPLLPL